MKQRQKIILMIILLIALTSCTNQSYIPITKTVINNTNITNNITTSENPFDQWVNTTSTPTFNKINTGHGTNELYAMNQDVTTSSSVRFDTITLQNGGDIEIDGGEIHYDSIGLGFPFSDEITIQPYTYGSLQAQGIYWPDAIFSRQTDLWFEPQYNRLRIYGSGANSLESDICTGNSCATVTEMLVDTKLSQEQVEDYIGAMTTGNTEDGITVTYQDSDGTLDFEVTVEGGNPFDQWVNKTSNISVANINVSENYQSLTDTFGAGHQIHNTGSSSIILGFGGCQYAGNPATEFLCSAPYNAYDKPGIINNTGRANLAIIKMGHVSTNDITTSMTGDANLIGGTTEVGNNYMDGNGNLGWGTGKMNFTAGSKGNIGIGNQNDFEADAVGGGAFGQLHNIGGNYCYAFGAANTCDTAYGVALGYANIVTGGTSVALGRGNEVSSLFSGAIGYYNDNSAQQTYVLGRYVDESRNFHVTLGNGEPADANRDLVINKTHIIINKDTIHNNITSTGSNSGTSVCIDANNQLCPCGSCA